MTQTKEPARIEPYPMDFMKTLFLSFLIYFLNSSNVMAVDAPVLHQVPVKLFGQPCQLAGPLSEETLGSIHKISPEQVFPETNPTYSEKLVARTRTVLTEVKKHSELAALNPDLARYREKVLRRLEAQLDFLEALSASKVKTKGDSSLEKLLAKAMTKHLSEAKLKQLLDKAKKGGDGAKAQTLLDFVNEIIVPEPEDEFHQAIRGLNVQYQCSFEENSAD